MRILEILKVILLGIVEGITEWLPISSTGHILLFDTVFPLYISERPEAFMEIFKVVIQLGAIVAVIVLFWRKLFPVIVEKKDRKLAFNADMAILNLWGKVIIGCLPAAVFGLLLDDFLEQYLQTPLVISLTLIIYGVIFILIENKNKNRVFDIQSTDQLTYKQAFLIGLFQVLALIPGTSRSGATIIGALLIGVARPVGAEFTFYLAIPVMLGASALKVLKFLLEFGMFTGVEFGYILLAMAVAFIVSMLAIKFLMNFVKKNDFKPFGWYRIILGAVVIATLVLPAML